MHRYKNMSLRKKKKLGTVAALLGLLWFLWSSSWLGTALGLALMAVGVGCSIKTIRCPACGKSLLTASGSFCKCCGAKIDWDKKEE